MLCQAEKIAIDFCSAGVSPAFLGEAWRHQKLPAGRRRYENLPGLRD
jgi:hypothetical protein